MLAKHERRRKYHDRNQHAVACLFFSLVIVNVVSCECGGNDDGGGAMREHVRELCLGDFNNRPLYDLFTYFSFLLLLFIDSFMKNKIKI